MVLSFEAGAAKFQSARLFVIKLRRILTTLNFINQPSCLSIQLRTYVCYSGVRQMKIWYDVFIHSTCSWKISYWGRFQINPNPERIE